MLRAKLTACSVGCRCGAPSSACHHVRMPNDGHNFEDTLRAMARELSESVERAMEQVDLDDLAGMIGVDADRAKEWMNSAGSWFRAQTESFAEEHEPLFADAPAADPSDPREQAVRPAPSSSQPDDGTFATAGPHPLDLPTDDQGAALAALDSGRWTVEPGTNALSVHGQGPGPSDALGLVRELRVRDWIAADGAITLAGRHALKRWLEASAASGR